MYSYRTAAVAIVVAALTLAAVGCDKEPPDRADTSESSTPSGSNTDTSSTENGERGTSTDSEDSTGDPGSDGSQTSDTATDEADTRIGECVQECVESRQMQSEPIEKIRRECEKDCQDDGN